MIIFSTLMSFISSQRDQGERGAAAERRHPAVGAGVQGEALRTDPAVQEQQQEGATAAAAAAWEKVDRVEGRKECLLSSLSSFPMPHLHTHTETLTAINIEITHFKRTTATVFITHLLDPLRNRGRRYFLSFQLTY